MKALSIRQPWAELILQGRKTIELRTWRTHYRGPLAIHAAQELDELACAAHGLDPAALARGALVGVVELVDIVVLNDERWEALRDQHLGVGSNPGDRLGWQLVHPGRLPQPVSMPGRRSLFNVPDDWVLSEQSIVAASEPPAFGWRRGTIAGYHAGAGTGHDPEKPFELRVVPDGQTGYGLALYQWPMAVHAHLPATLPGQSGSAPRKPQRLVELKGSTLRAVADHVLEALRKAGYKSTDLSAGRREPFRLDEESGLRLGLLFVAVKPLARMQRIEAISQALRTMPSEEAYYWFSKCTAVAGCLNARQALRILLSGQ